MPLGVHAAGGDVYAQPCSIALVVSGGFRAKKQTAADQQVMSGIDEQLPARASETAPRAVVEDLHRR
ncbi:hypothetical protein D3C75_1261290 [compost metagenome]